MQWRKRPTIYEIHTLPWLAELSARHGTKITLANVPAAEWDALGALHADAVWFMGVWARSPKGIEVANQNAGLQEDFHRALSDYTSADNIGSAYCVREYVAEERLGGPAGLAQARAELAKRNLRLILDFVPNHVAPDHPWTLTNPEYFILGTNEDLQRAPMEFFEANGVVVANGRDPFFAPWPDVAQLNAFGSQFRTQIIETVKSIAAQCDGMRCDMAMLMLNNIFERTWGARAGAKPDTEYWRDVIDGVKAEYPNVKFIAEAYWDLEYELMQNGFDYCYDKRLYDRLEHEGAESVRGHLMAGVDYQDKLLRFIENHDEPRAAATFAPLQERAAAVVISTVPGAKLIYDGQLEGRKIKLPVFFARRATEPKNYELDSFYRALLKNIDADLYHEGEWMLCDCQGWSDNDTNKNLLAWTWLDGQDRALMVVNYSPRRAQAMVRVPWADLRNRVWRFTDPMNGEVFIREGNQLADQGLFVDLDMWRYHFLVVEH